MVSFISSWAQQIIFAVIIGTILQMLLPEGKNKKYIKIVIGVYVLFAVISPVIGKDLDIDLNEFNLSLDNTTTSLDETNNKNINDIFVTNLVQDIKSKLNNKGYSCENVELQTNENYEVEKITITGIYEVYEDGNEDEKKEEQESKNNVKINSININEVQIGEKENSIKEQVVKGIPKSEEKDLKEYLSETYNVKEKNISID